MGRVEEGGRRGVQGGGGCKKRGVLKGLERGTGRKGAGKGEKEGAGRKK